MTSPSEFPIFGKRKWKKVEFLVKNTLLSPIYWEIKDVVDAELKTRKMIKWHSSQEASRHLRDD